MHSYFVVGHHSGIELNCFAKNFDQDKGTYVTTLQRGDRLEITDEGFYVDGSGWFILTVLNEHTKMFLSFTDLEECMQQNLLLNKADLEIKLSLWRDQIDQALKERNAEWFKFVSRKLSSLQSIG